MKQGDIGTEIIFTITDRKKNIIDLTNAEKAFVVFKVKGIRFEREAEILLPRTDGKVRYIIQDGDLEVPGEYEIEVRIEFNDGDIFTSSRIYQEVEPAL